ncbi:MAG: helix-turn-helix domain-containing protein [Pseudomonadota bacterium]|nr:helix-turn-helix domain-containing protein [Pseudomonadota bacterium]
MPDSGRRVLDEALASERRLNIHAVDPEREAPESRYRGVGSELRAERNRLGLDLDDVAQRLRIRKVHIAAIEEGRFGDLPGRIYAIGFLRSYAEFLGADGDVCVQLFKDEAGTSGGHSRRLEFPIPPSENRRPGPLTLLVALALAAVVYAGWYAYDRKGEQLVEVVPEVPERFLRQLADSPQAALDPGIGGSGPRPAMAIPAVPATTAVPGAAMAAEQDPRALAPIALASMNSPATEAAAEAAQSAPAAATGQAAATEGAGVPALSASEIAEPRQIALAGPPPVPAAVQRDDYVPRVYGIANVDARVVIRATGRAQVLVKQAGGRTVLPHRVLQAGDEYRAPNLEGLVLQSDNVDGLEVVVDGKVIGPVSVLADSSRMLALDPAVLLSRAAKAD